MAPQPPAGKLRLGSLFSGYGGLDLAAGQALNAKPVWFAETNPAVSAVFSAHWPGIPNLGDVAAIDWAGVPAVDVLCGGFPCQDLSTAGLMAGMAPGTRSGLWEHMAAAIAALRPAWVVVENVTGLLSTAAQTGSAYGDCGAELADSGVEPGRRGLDDLPAGPVRGMGVVLADLARLGFDAAWATVPARWAGACHQRRRVFILAWPADPHPARI
jgi:DNA (cytosine-5)-methyltransferase 1